jgi:hydantoinase/carbamoylase family amidase
MKDFEPDQQRITRDIKKLSEITSKEESGYTRISFSDEDRRARDYLVKLMRTEANLKVKTDAVGNIIGRRSGKKESPCIMIGSHLDTVRGGGRFDGVAGVIAGLEVARIFEKKRHEMLHPLEVVIFLAEEPSPFGISTIGSRGMAGLLSEKLFNSLSDGDGRTLGQALKEMGGNPNRIKEAIKSPNDVLVYLELHIEQGRKLYSQNNIIGVVTGITGIYRGKIEIIGSSEHSGTTSMDDRKDALAAASEIILSLERICRNLGEIVGTIGNIEVYPNSINVIPGKVVLNMDLRSLKGSKAQTAISKLNEFIRKMQIERDITVKSKMEMSSRPVKFSSNIIKRICKICEQLNIPFQEISSGAGHDASHISELGTTCMVFVPSKDGKSHCPQEWTEFEHICQGTMVLAKAIEEIDRGKCFE